jgi:hypothetical protein
MREFGEISEIDASLFPENPWVVIITDLGSRHATMKTMKESGVIVVWRPNIPLNQTAGTLAANDDQSNPAAG